LPEWCPWSMVSCEEGNGSSTISAQTDREPLTKTPSMPRTVDVVVLGVGGFGSAACYHLARRGVSVLGLEQFLVGHDRGSSHGDTRIIRQAYFEHPDYVPLLKRAYVLWDQLAAAADVELFRRTPLLLSGPVEGETISGALKAAALHGLDVESLTTTEAHQRYPGIRLPDDHAVVIEPNAGFLWVERCVARHAALARQAGAEIQEQCPVRRLHIEANHVRIETDEETIVAARLVVTAGAWTGRLLAELGWPLTPVRKFVGWFATTGGAYAAMAGYPVYYVEMPSAAYYGFPSLDGQTIKVAEHLSGEPVTDPATVDRTARASDVALLTPFVQSTLSQATTRLVRHSVCLYTLTPDRHFLVDRHRDWPHVTIAAGFSGHGFKFTSVLGETLSELCLDGQTSLPVEFLSARRLM
jgi:sarcosine oxidase